MPGIAGIITRKPRQHAMEELLAMAATLKHEAFYSTGIWVEESLGLYVAWAAREGSFEEDMPLRNERGDVTLIFSGEEFPEPGIADRLKARGHSVEREGSSYLVHVYEDEPEFPTSLNGRFHGIVADQSTRKAVLFNDRYAMHRLYYYEAKDGLYFSAEAKAILAVRPETRELNPTALGEFVSCGAVLDNKSLFRGIRVLPPASRWMFANGSLEYRGSYFRVAEWQDQEALDEETYYTELRDVFAKNLPRYFKGREPVAMSLTGGLDTRIIMAWHKAEPSSLPCYTFGGMLRACEDVAIARRISQACNQSHTVIPVTEEFLSDFPRYSSRAVYLTDGCVDVSRAADLFLNERARQIAPVRMTGNYGGEVLRKVRAFKPVAPMQRLFSDDVLQYTCRAAETYRALLRDHPVSFAVFKQAPWRHYGISRLEQTQLSMRSPFLDNDVVRTLFRAPLSTFASSEISVRLIANGNRDLLHIRTDRGIVRTRAPGASAISRAVLEFLFKAEYAYDMGMPQWVARVDHLLAPLRLERLLLGRHKIFHYRTWYKNALAGYVREMLLDRLSMSRPYVNQQSVEEVVRGHLRGDRNYTEQLHALLTLETIHRLFLDGQKQAAPKYTEYTDVGVAVT